MKVAICAYGAGNVRSVQLAFERLGVSAEPAQRAATVCAADLAVLPGVGSAAAAMAGLRRHGLDEALRERAAAGRPTLGICLGLQIALEESEEDGGVAGIGLLPGRAYRLREGRVPRMGWSPVESLGETFYFCHAYAADTPSATAAAEGVTAVAEHGPFLGVQFHPEKSQREGLALLERFFSK